MEYRIQNFRYENKKEKSLRYENKKEKSLRYENKKGGGGEL